MTGLGSTAARKLGGQVGLFVLVLVVFLSLPLSLGFHVASVIVSPRPRANPVRVEGPRVPFRCYSTTPTNNENVAGADATPTKVVEEEERPKTTQLGSDELAFALGYLNQHHAETLKKFAQAFSALGTEMAKSNSRSGGSFVMKTASITDINTQNATLSVLVQRRNKPDVLESVAFPLTADPISERRRRYTNLPPVPEDVNRLPIDDIARKLNRLCWVVGDGDVTGKLIQLATQLGGAEVGKLPENMYLNQVPHNRYVRQYFYDKSAQAVRDAVIACSQGKLTNRMKIVSQFPEMNPSMDSYRIGTILEMARAICIRLAEENVRVRLCVQGSMGVGTS